jgi:hypothetical protein
MKQRLKFSTAASSQRLKAHPFATRRNKRKQVEIPASSSHGKAMNSRGKRLCTHTEQSLPRWRVPQN